MNYRLSVSTGLNQLRDCPKCFWLHYNKGLKRPAGIFPSLPSGMDEAIKKHFDVFRDLKTLPENISKKMKGMLVDMDKIKKWRDWRTGLECKHEGHTLIGALDDCLIKSNKYSPIDYKTKGSRPQEGYGEKYYQLQLDVYSYLLNANDFKSNNEAYLIFYSPDEVNGNNVIFNIDVFKIKTNWKNAQNEFKKAIKILRGKIPESGSHCIYCNYAERRINGNTY